MFLKRTLFFLFLFLSLFTLMSAYATNSLITNNDVRVTGYETIVMEQGKSKVYPVFKIKNFGDKIYHSIQLRYDAPQGLSSSGRKVSIMRRGGEYPNHWARITLNPQQEVTFNPSDGNVIYLETLTDQEKITYGTNYRIYFEDEEGYEYVTPGFNIEKFVIISSNIESIPIYNYSQPVTKTIGEINNSSDEMRNSAYKIILSMDEMLIYMEEKKDTATSLQMFLKEEQGGNAIFTIMITANLPSPLAQNNFLGNGWISLIFPESIYVYYDSIKIYGTSNVDANDYVEYQPMSSSTIEKLELFKFSISKIPVIGLIADVSRIKSSGESSQRNIPIDLNYYDVVNLDWQIPLFTYWRKIKVEVPIEITNQLEVGLYAYWQSIAVSSDGTGPSFVRDNIVEPGLLD